MVYGDQLAFFSEQFRYFDYFTMKPNTVASYSTREPLGKVRGVFQYMKRGELRREESTLADVNVPTFWTRQKLKVGDYFIQKNTSETEKKKEDSEDEEKKEEAEIYRIVNPADWLFEGGFCCYVLESVIGNTDEQQPFEYVDLGQNSYD